MLVVSLYFCQISVLYNLKMSPTRTASHWLLLLFICSLQSSAYLAHQDDGDSARNVTDGHEKTEHHGDCIYDYDDTDPDLIDVPSHTARKPTKKPTDILLCHNLRGCECNGKHDRANCSCAVSGIRNRQKVNPIY